MRILLGLSVISEQLIQFMPNLPFLYGPGGSAPAGLHDVYSLSVWRWTVLLFQTDSPAIVWSVFWSWVAVALVFLAGWHTRIASVLLYLLTLCFLNRNPALRTNAEDLLSRGALRERSTHIEPP